MKNIPNLTLDTRVSACEGVLMQELEGESVLLNLSSGIYFGLDEVGTRIWKLLEQPLTATSIAVTISNEYDVQFDRCAREVLVLIEDMSKANLITTKK